jgi:hypothetical protein
MVPMWFTQKRSYFSGKIIGLESNLSLLTYHVSLGRSHLFPFFQSQLSGGMRPVIPALG